MTLYSYNRSMGDLTPLMPQMRLFLNFLDSLLDEKNFKMNLLVLEVYGVLAERMGPKAKPHLRSFCAGLLKHLSDQNPAVSF